MRVIMMGSPEFAVPTLDAIIEAGHEVVAVYSQPPRPAGRGKKLQPTAVAKRAEALGLEVRTPKSLKNEEAQDAFAALGADVAIVAAYGLILPQAILDAPRFGCVNVHASLLPRWRGAAPVHRAIMEGDEETGVTLMQMEAGLDTGPMLMVERRPIEGENTAELTRELAELGARMVARWLADPTSFEPKPQPEEDVTYASKIDKEEARIDWHYPARQILRQIQGLAPWPGAWTEAKGERIKILAADICPETAGAQPGEVLDEEFTIACGQDAIAPRRVQRAGRGACSTDELLRGFEIPPGTLLE